MSSIEDFTFEKLVAAWDERALVSHRPAYRNEPVARVKQGLAPLLQKPAAAITRTDATSASAELAEADDKVII